MIIHRVDDNDSPILVRCEDLLRQSRYFQDTGNLFGDCSFLLIGEEKGECVACAHVSVRDKDNWLNLHVCKNHMHRTAGKAIVDAAVKETGGLRAEIPVGSLASVRLHQEAGLKIESLGKDCFFMTHYVDPLLHVSMGEAVDKLTILEIKAKEIRDPVKLSEVLKEKEILDRAIPNPNSFFKHLLFAINLQIWNDQNLLRDGQLEFTETAKRITRDNQRRFRVKRLINETGGGLQEHKGYQATSVVLKHSGVALSLDHLSALIWYSVTAYDKVIVCVDNEYKRALQRTFAETDRVEFRECDDKPCCVIAVTNVIGACSDLGVNSNDLNVYIQKQ